MSNCSVPGAIAAISAATMEAFTSPRAKVLPVSSYVWNEGVFRLPTTRQIKLISHVLSTS
jgi:hypothetical protein